MAESAKVRLVRCPKCENLLPELSDYSVYQCGGCGTVLRAKNKHQDGESVSQKSDEERTEAASEKSANSVEKDTVDFSVASGTEAKSNPVSQVLDPACSESNDVECIESSENRSNMEADKNMNDLSNSMGRENGAQKSQFDSANATYLSTEEGYGRKVDWQTREMAEAEGDQRNSRYNSKGVRFSTSKYSKESLPIESEPIFGFENLLTTRIDEDGANKVKFLEHDRAEILRKLDELKDQFSRPSDMVHKTKEKVPMDDIINPSNPYPGYDNWHRDSTSASNRVPRQFSRPDTHVAGPPLSSYHSGFSPYSKGNGMSSQDYYSSMHNPNKFSGFVDPYGPEMTGRGLYQFPNSYQRSSHPYHSRQYNDANLDSLEHFQHNAILHQPSCTCYSCLEKYRQVSAPPPFAAGNRRFRDVSYNNLPYHPQSDAPYGPFVNNSRIGIPPMNFHDQQSQSRWSRDLPSEIGDFSSNPRPRRMLLSDSGRRCRPIFGGAPFLTCYNCFELLLLPKKVQQMVKKNELKIFCGACSTLLNFRFVNNKLILSEQGETEQIPLDVDNSSGNVGKKSDNFSSDDYDNSGYDFQSVDREPVLRSTDPSLSSAKQHVMQSFLSSSPSISEDEENSPEILITPMEMAKNFDQPSLSPPPPGSPLQSYFEYSSNDHVGNKFATGNRSSRSDQEKVKPNKVTSRQNSLKHASLVTEMKVPFNEYGDAYKEGDQSRAGKGGESIFTNIIKKSFRSNRADGKSGVSVNGHVIPYRLVKKAERLAGPIQPGKYWYDSRAGFWGVVGGPCLGIIPPFIEELNYPMPENCADGKTGVFVNGRELHQQDLDLLASRGLPSSRDRSYIIEISGRLLDEDTGEEMDCLGKLAPTIEKVRRGFGMKVPRTA